MNRRERRAVLKQNGKAALQGAPQPAVVPGIEELHAAALLHRKRGELLAAQTMCRAILAREPQHVGALIVMGGTSQEQGRNQAAIKFLTEALALDARSARAHDNLALTYQALGRHDEAVVHFSQAIGLGLGNVETLIRQIPAISEPLRRIATAWPRRLSLTELFEADGLRAIEREGLLLALLQSGLVCDLELERFFTTVRTALLEAITADRQFELNDGIRFFRALALQCFINEYIYPLGDTERSQSMQLRERLIRNFTRNAEIAPLDMIVMAMYHPLHTLPIAEALLTRSWPEILAPVLTQQVKEPIDEAVDRDAIPVLTGAADLGSLENQKQFDENPYPRWVARPSARPTTLSDYLRDKLGQVPRNLPQ
jgi:tetratricopeptide (TPR) repeat protein